ncbi:MAG: YcjF family protein, partial [Synechococcales cyanobacterium]
LGAKARHLIDNQRRQQANKIVERFQWIGAGAIAVTPLPVLDLLAAAAVNAQMVVEIGRVYGCDINLDRGRELALSLAKTLASLGIVKGVVQLVTTALQLNLTTVLLGKAIQGVTAAYLTRIAGKSFIEYFRQDQDWGDGGITEVVQQQFQLNRRDEFVKSFIQQAISKVVEPLQDHPLNLPLTLPSLTNIRVDGEPLELSRTEPEINPIPLNSFVHDHGASRINSSPDRGSVQSEAGLGQMNDWETPRMDENEW